MFDYPFGVSLSPTCLLFLALLAFVRLPRANAAAALQWTDGFGYRSTPVNPAGTGTNGFTRLNPLETGVSFTNTLAGDAYLTNAVAHNGSGVALGDIDGDGWVDIYFCNLQGPNRLYRNLGDFHFQDISPGPAACAGQLSTGAAFADIDGDNDLDLLVNGIAAGTRLFLNDGHGVFSEVSNSGLSRTASATSLTLADIDGDGDLDLYCTHYIDEMHLADPTVNFGLKKQGNQFIITSVNGEPATSPRLTNRFQIFGNGRVRELPEYHGLYRNDGNGHFTPILFDPGRFTDAAGQPIPPYRDWGLAAMFRDLNGDGAPDLYVCNDNASPDRMWLNTGRGTFRAFDPLAFRHTSRSSMGLDIADINRDGHDDIFVVDMLARDPARRLQELVKDLPDFASREKVSDQPRYNRNALFLGRADGTYAEAALAAGVAASDWSWCPIFIDVDLDGYEDLVITTGFSFDVMDQDSHDRIRKGRLPPHQLKRSRQFHPPWRTPKAAFHNRGNGTFEPAPRNWGFDQPEISNGAALADLDNDGDLDLVVNNFNSSAALYRNNSAAPRLAIRLAGRPPNTHGVGARIRVNGASVTQSQEMIAGGRYLSSDDPMRVFAAAPSGQMQIEVRWRNGALTLLTNAVANHAYELQETATSTTRPAPAPEKPLFTNVSSLLNHSHTEDPFDDWARQPLLPHRLSRLGPASAWFDVNGDGWEDLVTGAARGGKLALFLNQAGQTFRKAAESDFARSDAGPILAFRDSNGTRLLVAYSNLELAATTPSEIDLLDAQSLKPVSKFEVGPSTIGALALADIDADGDLDLFVGTRFTPGHFPEPSSSAIYTNSGGAFRLSTSLSAPFARLGMVSGATFADFDNDGALDLALSLEWGSIRLFLNRHGRFVDATSTLGLDHATGLWTSIAAGDFDQDGRMDLAAGNSGRNTTAALYPDAPLRIYYGDWDGNNTLELLEAWGRGNNFFPERDRKKLAAAFPDLPTRFPTHSAFSAATVTQILGERAARSAYVEATRLDSCLFLNRGTAFDIRPLPFEAQLAAVTSLSVADFDSDGSEDLFLAQNFYGVLTDLTRDDSGQGLLLRGLGNGQFEPLDALHSGINIPGEQRAASAADFNHDGRPDLVVAQNDGPWKLFRNDRARPSLRVQLIGPKANPDAIGAEIRLQFPDGTRGPLRVISAGTGSPGQTSPVHLLGYSRPPSGVWVRWPDQTEASFPVHDLSRITLPFDSRQ